VTHGAHTRPSHRALYTPCVTSRAAIWLSTTVFLGGCQGKPSESDTAAKAPIEYRGQTLDGEEFALSDLRGKVVLLNVWATWCQPCREELPELVALHRHYRDREFELVGISVDTRTDLRKVRSAVSYFGLDYPMVFDPDGHVLTALEVRGYPTSLLLGKDGALRWRRDGLIKPDDPELAVQIDAALRSP
jgi:cytochrome c biogenesis protein CcmG, thiol:disulfide interchange protein DsbE